MTEMTLEAAARRVRRETAVFDAYAGLRRIGFTYIGALRTLRTLGLSLAEAKAQADLYESALDRAGATQN